MFDTVCFHNMGFKIAEILNKQSNQYFITAIQSRELEESLNKRVLAGSITYNGKQNILKSSSIIKKRESPLETGLLGHSEAAALSSMRVGSKGWFEKFKENLDKLKKEVNEIKESEMLKIGIS